MADREDNVYMAKLAEQAERYDGKFVGLIHEFFWLAVLSYAYELASIALLKYPIYSFRNGRSHEEGGDYGCRTDGGGEESSFG